MTETPTPDGEFVMVLKVEIDRLAEALSRRGNTEILEGRAAAVVESSRLAPTPPSTGAREALDELAARVQMLGSTYDRDLKTRLYLADALACANDLRALNREMNDNRELRAVVKRMQHALEAIEWIGEFRVTTERVIRRTCPACECEESTGEEGVRGHADDCVIALALRHRASALPAETGEEAVLHEREECAKVAFNLGTDWAKEARDVGDIDDIVTAEKARAAAYCVAAAIRARPAPQRQKE